MFDYGQKYPNLKALLVELCFHITKNIESMNKIFAVRNSFTEPKTLNYNFACKFKAIPEGE